MIKKVVSRRNLVRKINEANIIKILCREHVTFILIVSDLMSKQKAHPKGCAFCFKKVDCYLSISFSVFTVLLLLIVVIYTPEVKCATSTN